jgi:molecular chaperone GrpE (heat shock protein)
MIHDIPKPQLSSDFTVEDIHKIREWHYERLKDATLEEQLADIRRRAEPVHREVENFRRTTKTALTNRSEPVDAN